MLCVYLWNKCSAVCQDRNPADGSCSLTVIQAAEKLTCCLESLCENECVQRNKSPAQCSRRVSVSFQPIGQDISCTKTHLTPCGLQWDGITHRFHSGLESSVFPRCGPGGDGLLAYSVLRVKSFLLQSRLKSKGSQNTTAATSCQQTSGYNWKHPALSLCQLMQTSPRTRVH